MMVAGSAPAQIVVTGAQGLVRTAEVGGGEGDQPGVDPVDEFAGEGADGGSVGGCGGLP
ncbi:hypothetical protein SDC9_100992 [bioreactor metagenome]|uniref:Uncharacterized protein n=1 Tax=bioreactor metagenome TaxID=1076179 RepID=A0A645AN79_9ZZZZ